jgi:hypothetical protein
LGLLQLWLADRSHLDTKLVHQVIAFAGSGRLAEGNDTSREFREFLGNIPSAVLGRYADECLTSKFEGSGFVLQDLVNEIGRRLDFEVTNGRYRGTANQPGYDGLWRTQTGQSLIVEVKTSDVYRIDLDVIAEYRKRVAASGDLELETSSILLVVGRHDTGGLEAQIRGSRHAWDMRLISVDSLLRLMTIKEDVGDPATMEKIGNLLVPREFTRLDPIVDLVFHTTSDIREDDDLEEEEADDSPAPVAAVEQQRTKKFTPVSFHLDCIARVEKTLNVPLVKRAKAAFASGDDAVRVVCSVSRRHGAGDRETYWFAFHPHQREFIEMQQQAYVAFGCGSPATVLLLPARDFIPLLADFNTTQRMDRTYWHVHIDRIAGELLLTRKGGADPVNVSRYLI